MCEKEVKLTVPRSDLHEIHCIPCSDQRLPPLAIQVVVGKEYKLRTCHQKAPERKTLGLLTFLLNDWSEKCVKNQGETGRKRIEQVSLFARNHWSLVLLGSCKRGAVIFPGDFSVEDNPVRENEEEGERPRRVEGEVESDEAGEGAASGDEASRLKRGQG
jgi:hypothetical protein